MTTVKLSILAFLLLCLSECRERADLTVLPAETQKGANTFGCHIDNKLFVADKNLGRRFLPPERSIRAYYSTQKLILGACLNFDQPEGTCNDIYMRIDNSLEQVSIPISYGYFSEGGFGHECWAYCGENVGEVFLTRFDTINNVVSGRFQFSAQCYSHIDRLVDGAPAIQVTDGRFDIELLLVEEHLLPYKMWDLPN